MKNKNYGKKEYGHSCRKHKERHRRVKLDCVNEKALFLYC